MSRVGSPVDRDQVGEQAGLHRADLIVEAEDARIARSGGDQHVDRAHAPGRHQLHLARILAMREHADVAADAHPHSRRERGGEAGALVPDRLRLGRLPVPAAIAGDRIGGGEGRAIAGAMLLHQAEDLRRAGIAMLDRVGAGEDRAAHPFRGAGMDGDLAAGGMGGLDRHLHLVEREGRPARLARPPAIIAVELHPVGAGADLAADGGEQARPVGLLGAAGDEFGLGILRARRRRWRRSRG